MNITLIDVDSSISNLALMKISAYHKEKGDSVTLGYNPLLDNPDKIYLSKVFTFTPDPSSEIIHNCEVVKGGTGFDLTQNLPQEIEDKFPDYTLYPQFDYSVGFTTRGCIRKCPFCVVSEKEGSLRATGDIYSFWYRGHKKIMLLDNNLSAHDEQFDLICKQCIKEKLKVSFNQGLDIRCMTKEKVEILKKVSLMEQIHFAWDDIRYESAVRKGIELFDECKMPRSRVMFLCLVGFNSTPEEDLYRIETLKGLRFDPYVMVFRPYNKQQKEQWLNFYKEKNIDVLGPEYSEYLMMLKQWVNAKALFKKMTWTQFKLYSKDHNFYKPDETEEMGI